MASILPSHQTVPLEPNMWFPFSEIFTFIPYCSWQNDGHDSSNDAVSKLENTSSELAYVTPPKESSDFCKKTVGARTTFPSQN